MITLAEVADQLRAARHAAGVSQTELARRAGVARTTVARMESVARGDMSVSVLLRLLEAAGYELKTVKAGHTRTLEDVRAEVFVRTVEREFGLEGMTPQADLSPGASKNIAEEKQEGSIHDRTDTSAMSQPWSLEETQRRAAEDWRRNYYDKRAERGPGADSSHASDRIDKENVQPERDVGPDFDPE